ncbi:bifunctional glycosyltransferase family 2/GtrA family protein [uncultured Pseudokineococcus sp.]|uniref:bifunctional glycosyltransferase family 2/GtrA family protein n=1 Tax=uncultured Pseudokineococcus sp. TaxID=1642928 RepID=UPI00342A0955
MTTSPPPQRQRRPHDSPTTSRLGASALASGPGGTDVLARAADLAVGAARRGPVLDLVVPVYDEQESLAPCVRRLEAHLAATFPWSYRITVVDNASRDDTWQVAQGLERELGTVRALHLKDKGRGRALHAAWLASDAEVLAYTDVDLSTDLAALLPLVAPLVTGHSDLAIGSRLTASSRVVRGPRREVVSRCYNLLLRGTFRVGFSDAQCGFKAVRRDVAVSLLPLVEDTGWFFDTELLLLAERSGLRIAEVPVDWVDDPDSRVDVVATALADLRGMARVGRALVRGDLPLGTVRAQLGRRPLPVPESLGAPAGLLGQMVRFAAVGAVSTLAFVALYALARQVVPAQAANLMALLVTAVANTAANRRLTFGIRGRARQARHHAQGLGVFALAWGLTAGALALLHALVPTPPRAAELAVLVGANLLATVLRFLALRSWVFAGDWADDPDEGPGPAGPRGDGRGDVVTAPVGTSRVTR